MPSAHSLEDLKCYHNEATQFFAAELLLLKESIPLIVDQRLAEAATLLISCGQTGAALLQLANQTDTHTGESAMLARAFMETITNFCYVSICDEKEYRAFILHPVYKHYHNVTLPSMEDNLDFSTAEEYADAATKLYTDRKEKQEKLKELPIVQEALSMFSDKKPYLNWTNKTLNERIEVIKKWGKLMDVFFTLNKLRYYSDASEALHGSLYGCTYNLGFFSDGFNTNAEELNKRLYKDSTYILLHLGMLIHESFTLISYTHDIKGIWDCSYKNRNQALSLLYHVLEKQPNA